MLTFVFLAVIVGIFIIQVVLYQVNYPFPEPITPWGALDHPRVLAGEYYRLFTSIFLHADQVHLFFNGLALYIIGRSVEAFFGAGRFGLIYLLGGLCGSVASFIFSRGPSVGASGAIFALFGAEMIFLYTNRQLLGRRAQELLRSLVILAALNFGIGFFTGVVPGSVAIDNWGHVGGFFAGLVLAWFIGPQYQVVADPTVPEGARVIDRISTRKTWLAPVLFMVGLAATMIYALTQMR